MIEELIKKYGSLRNIPQEELSKIGYQKKIKDGVIIIRPFGYDPEVEIRQRVAKIYKIPESILKNVSLANLRRMLKIIPHDPDDDDFRDELFWPDSTQTYKALLKSFVDNKYQEIPGIKKACEALEKFNIKTDVWQKGIGVWTLDIENAKILTEEEFLNGLVQEFNQAFGQFLKEGLKNPKACLFEIGAKLGLSEHPVVEEIIQIIRTSKEKLKLVLEICLRRAAKKDATSPKAEIPLFHLQRISKMLNQKTSADKMPKVFTLKICDKHPIETLTIGNDSNCCIGIYLKDEEFAGGEGETVIPYYLLDPATQFIEVYDNKRRVGMALCFAGCDDEKNPVMIINSVELNEVLIEVVDSVVDSVLEYAKAWACKAGYSYIVMGMQFYNTGITYGSKRSLGIEVGDIKKINPLGVEMYSDVISAEEREEEFPKVENVCFVEIAEPEVKTLKPETATFAESQKIIPCVVGPKEICEIFKLKSIVPPWDKDQLKYYINEWETGFSKKELEKFTNQAKEHFKLAADKLPLALVYGDTAIGKIIDADQTPAKAVKKVYFKDINLYIVDFDEELYSIKGNETYEEGIPVYLLYLKTPPEYENTSPLMLKSLLLPDEELLDGQTFIKCMLLLEKMGLPFCHGTVLVNELVESHNHKDATEYYKAIYGKKSWRIEKANPDEIIPFCAIGKYGKIPWRRTIININQSKK